MAVLFDGAGGFAQAVTWTPKGRPPADLAGIFTAAHAAAGAGDWPGASTVQPVLTVAAADVPDGAGQGDKVDISGAQWRAADLQPDGTGLVRVILER
nr:hypothetical protein [Oceanicella actignis]